MSTPYKCPICNGKGAVKKTLAKVNAVPISGCKNWYSCHGCFGTGIIWGYDPNVKIQPTITPNTDPYKIWGSDRYYSCSTK